MTSHKDKVIPLINRKILVGGLIIIAIGAVLIGTSPQSSVPSLIDKITRNTQSDKDTMEFITTIQGKQKTISFLKKDLLFNITITYDKNKIPQFVDIEKKPELTDFYKQVGFTGNSEDIAFVYPIFTQGAYGDHGFYDYYNKKCGPECLTISIPSRFVPTHSASMTASMVLFILNYSNITDVDVDKNPDILK